MREALLFLDVSFVYQKSFLNKSSARRLDIKMAGTSFLARGSRHQGVRHAGETRDKEAREKDKKSNQKWRRAAFFVLGYFCPVLNEICVYPRLYLLVRPQLIPYIQEKLFPEFNAQVSKAKLRSIVHAVGGIGSARTRKTIIKMENQHTTTNYLSFQNLHKLYKPSQTLQNIW